uniref:DOMON domain-containing protein n=1 Tax=Meloidogyne javanica TaxID=6303 RepID=A0A915M8D3_MELJA
MDSLLIGPAVTTICVLLLSSVLMLAQCCKKKKPRQIPQQGLPEDGPTAVPPPTQLKVKAKGGKKGVKAKKPPPKKVEDEPKVPGIGVGIDYQTLGNLDKNIFVKGQKQKDAGKAKKTPSVPAAAAKAPAGVEEAVQKEGLAAGGDYQTMADIDQNVFAKKDGAKSDAGKKSAAGSGSQKEAAPKEGIGAGADYQTWNAMDKDVFLKGKKPDDDKKSSGGGKGSDDEGSKAEAAPRAGIGQDPMLDCAIAIVFTISGKNQLYIQMAAQSIYPPPPLQYIAIGFSHDKLMGDDFVSECVLNTDGSLFNDVEVYASYNLEKSKNDRTLLNSTEHSLLYGNIEGKMEDGRLYCSFTQAIRPQFSLSSSRSNLIWNLDKSFWIMGATGGAQPDEINSHDTARGSHFYPILSSKVIDISTTSSKHYDLPIQYQENETKKFNKVNGTITPINSAFKKLIGGGYTYNNIF